MEQETKKCPHCGEMININAKKCRFCGEWLEEQATEEPKTVNCPFCGEEILSTAKKCKHCGEWLNKENSVQNEPQKLKKDPLLNISAMPNILMIFFCILFWGLFQPAWLLSRANYQTKKTNEHTICGYLNQIGNCVSIQVPIILTVLNLAVNLICYIAFDEWGFLGIIAIINSLILSIIEIKIANKIEAFISKHYGLNIRLNKVLIFFFQSIYLNYFFLTYKDRLDKANRV